MAAKNPEYTSFEGVKLDARERDRYGFIGSATITLVAEEAADLRGPHAKPDRSDAMRRMMTWAVFGPYPMPADYLVNTADPVKPPIVRKRPPIKGTKPRLTDTQRLARRAARQAARKKKAALSTSAPTEP